LKRRKLDTIREEKEYKGGRIEEWDEEDEMGQMGDIMDEL